MTTRPAFGFALRALGAAGTDRRIRVLRTVIAARSVARLFNRMKNGKKDRLVLERRQQGNAIVAGRLASPRNTSATFRLLGYFCSKTMNSSTSIAQREQAG